MSAHPDLIDLRDMLGQNAIKTHMQPIEYERQYEIVGVEALSRGRNGDGKLLPPAQLFRIAAEQDLVLALDRACRRSAIEQFVPLHAHDPKLVLFLNTHLSMLLQDVE